MKKEAILGLLLIMFLLPFASAGFIDWFKEKVQLGPSDTADVQIDIQNIAPTIDSVSITSTDPLILNPSPGTTDVTLSFFVSDQNGVDPFTYNDLDDTSATATLTHSISGASRTTAGGAEGSCSGTTAGNQRRYDCTITMQYSDEPSLSGNPANVWNVQVDIQDQGGLSDSDSSQSFDIDPLLDISVTPPSFPALVQGQQATTTTDTTITNNGNVEVPGTTPFEYRIKVTPNNLLLGGTGPENIPSTAFLLGAHDAVDVCDPAQGGTTLADAADQEISGLALLRGASPNNEEDMKYCVNVPLGISSGSYTATGGSAWTIKLTTP